MIGLAPRADAATIAEMPTRSGAAAPQRWGGCAA
jgi:hypothetical protein